MREGRFAYRGAGIAPIRFSRARRRAAVAGLLLGALLALAPGARAQGAPAVLVDPALLPAWELLVNLPGPDRRTDGARYRTIAERAGLAIVVEAIPIRADAGFIADERRIIISPAYVDEDPRALAAVLAHELTHVNQWLAGNRDPPPGACYIMEVGAIMAQNAVWVALWGEEPLPRRTRLERSLTADVQAEREGGIAGLYAAVERNATYRETCATA